MNNIEQESIQNPEQFEPMTAPPIDQLRQERKKLIERGVIKIGETKRIHVEGLMKNETIGAMSKPSAEDQVAAQIDIHEVKNNNDEEDAYNPAMIKGTDIVIFRIDPRGSHVASRIVCCEPAEEEDTYRPIPEIKEFVNYQDPRVVKVQGQNIFIVIKTIPNDNGGVSAKSEFYRFVEDFKQIESEPFCISPIDGKDYTLTDLQSQDIGVFGRPVGNEFGRGQVTFAKIKKPDELSETINNPDRMKVVLKFSEGEWGGVNDTILLEDGNLFVLGHIARFGENGQKEYFSTWGIFDPAIEKFTNFGIFMEADDIKFSYDLKDEEISRNLHYLTAIQQIEKGKFKVIGGVGDTSALRGYAEMDIEQLENNSLPLAA